MNIKLPLFCLSLSLFLTPALWAESSALTVYNDLFAVVRETRTLDLKSGENEIRLSDITAHI